MKEAQLGFHPVRGCFARLKEHQQKIDTDFEELRARFAQGFPSTGSIPPIAPSQLNSILVEVLTTAPARLRQLKQQLAECLYWELQRHGKHLCAGQEVSEATIRLFYQEAA